MSEKAVSNKLRRTFLVHFIVDFIFAIPLLFFPSWFLHLLQFPDGNFVFARILGATLLAIGSTSLIVKNSGRDVYAAMLTLKIIFASSVTIGIALSLMDSSMPHITWYFLIGFILYVINWSYFRFKL